MDAGFGFGFGFGLHCDWTGLGWNFAFAFGLDEDLSGMDQKWEGRSIASGKETAAGWLI